MRAALPAGAAIILLATLHSVAAQQAAPDPVKPEPAKPAPAWLPRPGANLLALDKVSARTTPISLDVGGTTQFGTLTIVLRACDIRPPDQASDAAAYLDVTDSNPGAAQFHAWLVRSAPAVSGMQHPVYDIRLAGCR